MLWFLSGIAMFTLIIYFFGYYILTAFVYSRVGNKFSVGSFWSFLIPFYRIFLLCDCAAISRWLSLGIIAPCFVAWLVKTASFHMIQEPVANLALLVLVLTTCFIWGKIAERLGKNFWVWAIITPLFCFIPVLFLAFDSSKAVK
jgi:hypothetical protein